MNKNKMPALFIGHGSPMNAIEDNPFSRHLKKLGEKIPKPRVVLVVSAHWQSRGSKLLHIANPKTIYDFYGFPEELYRVVYPAPGAPIEAEALSNRLGQKVIQLDEQWGFDHGVWAVLCHLYPKADIPVLQLSLNKDFGFREHFEFAKSLKYLRDEGVLILGSGNVVHNLGALDFSFRSGPVQWAVEFDEMIKRALLNRDLDELLAVDLSKKMIWKQAHPTVEHYLPLLYTMAVADPSEEIVFPFEEIQGGCLSMRSVQIG